MRTLVLLTLLALVGWTAGCGGDGRPDAAKVREAQTRRDGEPDYVMVRWIRVAFDGVPADHAVTRSQEEASARAQDVLKRVAAPDADFAALVGKFSDEPASSAAGIFNDGATPKVGYQPRKVFVPAVAKAAFGLAVGAAVVVGPDEDLNRHGYFVLTRTE